MAESNLGAEKGFECKIIQKCRREEEEEKGKAMWEKKKKKHLYENVPLEAVTAEKNACLCPGWDVREKIAWVSAVGQKQGSPAMYC